MNKHYKILTGKHPKKSKR